MYHMKQFRKVIVVGVMFMFAFTSNAQYLQFKPFKPYKWMVGVGWNVVDDDGRNFSHLLDYENSWQYLPYPTTLSVDRYIKKGMSVEAIAAFNIYDASKVVNDTTGLSGYFGSFDATFKYSFYQFLQPTRWFDPYVGAGVGFVYREAYKDDLVPTCNVTLGMNFWIKNFGIRLQTAGKLGLTSDIWTGHSDYVQHTAMLMYRFPDKAKKDNSFNKRKHKWTKDKPKYKGKSR